MVNTDQIMTLAKVIVAAAWADGELSPEEKESLKDLLFHFNGAFPYNGISEEQQLTLNMYLDSPVEQAERERLIQDLGKQLYSEADRDRMIAALQAVIEADGVVTPEEQAVFNEVMPVIYSIGPGLFKKMGGLVKKAVQRRSDTVDKTANREDFLEEYINNKVLYGVQRRLDLDANPIDMPVQELRKLCLAGGLMARIAQVDRQVSESEFETMTRIASQNWDLSKQAAVFLAEVAISEVGAEMDLVRLTRELSATATTEERIRLLDMLFAVADADGFVTQDELRTIENISGFLLSDRRIFVDAKLKIPADRRAS